VLAQVFDEKCGVKPQIKWPNDILINNKKVAGILTEMQAEQDSVLYVIIGIGINVNQANADLEEDIERRATSLSIETGKQWEMAPLIQQILQTFEKKYDHYLHNGFNDIKTDWENYGFRLR